MRFRAAICWLPIVGGFFCDYVGKRGPEYDVIVKCRVCGREDFW